MKKILLLAAIFSFIGCDKDNEEANTNCNCDGKFSTPQTYPNYFIIQNVKIYCDTRQLVPGQNIQDNAIFIGCK